MYYLTKVADVGGVFLSLGIAFIGSYAAITTYEQFRICSKGNMKKTLSLNALLIITAVSLGGVAIFSMHFVGMSAIKLYDNQNNQVFLAYDIGLTVASLLAVLILCYFGLVVSSSNKVYTTEQAEAVEEFIRDCQHKTIQEIKSMPHKYEFLFSVLVNGLPLLALGGCITATGVCVMHYIGIKAIVFGGTVLWDGNIVFASVLIALVAATAAFWILFRLLSLFPYIESLRICCAIVMSIAVNGMHYTGMAAAQFAVDESVIEASAQSSSATITASTATSVALTACVIVVCIIFILAIADLRGWYYELAISLAELDRLAAKLNMGRTDSKMQFIQLYQNRRKHMLSEKENDRLSSNGSNTKKSLSEHFSSILPLSDSASIQNEYILEIISGKSSTV